MLTGVKRGDGSGRWPDSAGSDVVSRPYEEAVTDDDDTDNDLDEARDNARIGERWRRDADGERRSAEPSERRRRAVNGPDRKSVV